MFKRLLGRITNRGQPYNASAASIIDYLKSLGLTVEEVDGSSDLSEVIYFICVKHLSETMSKMPWERVVLSDEKGQEKQHDYDLEYIMNVRPNEYYSASSLWAAAELNKIHHGNAYIYIERRNGRVHGLWLLPSEEITVYIDNAGIFGTKNAVWYRWDEKRTGKSYKFFNQEIIHLKTSTSFDGICGVPITTLLATQINTNKHSQAFLNKLYKANMFGSKIMVYYTGEANKKFEKSISARLESFSSEVGSGKFIPLPMGMEAKLLDMKLADAQFFENNKVSALRLAAAFGIKPNVINDYDKSSYSNSETQQIDFYVNTLQPLFLNYEQELTYKLLGDTKRERLVINEKILFKMDSKTQAEVYSKYVNNFIMTPNEVREELRLPYSDGADELIGNGSTISLSDIGKQYGGGEE